MFRDQFFAAISAVPEHEEVQSAAGPVRVTCLTAGEKDRYDVAVAKEPETFRSRLVAMTARDGEGHRVFRDEDIPRLSTMPLPVIEPLVDAAMRVNRMGAKDVEALEKNSTGRSEESSSGSA
jgi:hypothetical protein